MGIFRTGFAALLTAYFLVLSPGQALAQENSAEEVAEAPPMIPTSAFASQTQLNGARLSPDGRHFAFTTIINEERFLTVYDADTRTLTTGARLGEPDRFNWFQWAGNDRVLVSVDLENRTETYSFSRLIVFEIPTQRLFPLTLRRMSFDGDTIIHTGENGDYVLLSIANGVERGPAVWRFDLNGPADEEPEGVRVHSERERTFHWMADNTGIVRLSLEYVGNGRYLARYRSNATDNWETVSRTRADEEDAFEHWDFMGLRAGSDKAYSIAIPEGGDRRALIEFDFETGQPGAVVFQSPDADVSGVTFDADNNPIAVGYSGDTYRREWIDPEIRRWRDQLGDALPQSRLRILDVADDRSRLLVLQASPSDPGALYVFTPEEMRLELFAEYRPQVPAAMLAEPNSIRYDARDGTSIQAYLTLPVGREAQGLPLIVHPHGGPYGIRDNDNYNDMVQLLANRGYAVIQPNFRGSGGYGESFELLGNGQIGRAMQDDLDDAVAHLVDEGIVDPQRVCILGSSYGGFAAAWGVIRNPEIYRCGVSFAGVMHFERQLNYDSDFLFRRNRERWWDRVDGDQSNFDLDDVSPAVQIARLTRPLLLVHGEEDEVVPFNQYEMMISRADNADVELETLSFEESGHGFHSPEDEQAYYDAIVDFLARHNPAD